jgi:hypothetical protein
MIDSGLWIILLEAGVALGLLVFIVWWTLPGSGRRHGTRNDGDSSEDVRKPK